MWTFLYPNDKQLVIWIAVTSLTWQKNLHRHFIDYKYRIVDTIISKYIALNLCHNSNLTTINNLQSFFSIKHLRIQAFFIHPTVTLDHHVQN